MYSIGKHHVSLSDIHQDVRLLEVFLRETPQGYPVFYLNGAGQTYEVSFAEARLEYGMSPFYTKHEVIPKGEQLLDAMTALEDEREEDEGVASHERQEGFLDYGSGRYKLIGLPGRNDCYLHTSDWLEVWNGMQWMTVQVLADEWGRWYFLDVDGERVSVQIGMRARQVGEI